MTKRPSLHLISLPDHMPISDSEWLNEAYMIADGVEIAPRAEHVHACVDWLDEMQAKMSRLTDLAGDLHVKFMASQRASRIVARRIKPRSRRISMADTIAIKSAIKLVVDAVNDTENALGSGSAVNKFSAYGNLIGDLMALINNINDLPTEVKGLSPDDIKGLVDELVGELQIENAHAKSIVDASLAVFDSLMTGVLANAEALASAIKGDTGAVAQIKEGAHFSISGSIIKVAIQKVLAELKGVATSSATQSIISEAISLAETALESGSPGLAVLQEIVGLLAKAAATKA